MSHYISPVLLVATAVAFVLAGEPGIAAFMATGAVVQTVTRVRTVRARRADEGPQRS